MGIKKVYNSKQGQWFRKLLGISKGEVLPTPHELRIVRVTSKSMLRDFVEYPVRLYKGSPYYCPPLIDGDMDTLTKGKNPNLEHCDYVCYLAYRGDRIVGRIAGIINHNCNERWHQNRARFGFFDFEDDEEVVDALMDAVRKWAIGLVRQVSDGKLVGFGVAMPSITKALQRSQGKLWPFGFIPILKALKSRKAEVMDLMLIAVDPEYQGKGLIALIFDLMIPVVQQYGVRFLESNLELEHNVHVQVQWNFFRKIHHKTHRCYVTPLTEKGEELAKRRREKRAKEEETRSEEQPNRLLMPRASVEEMQKYEGENR